jgi:hypothetical protein
MLYNTNIIGAAVRPCGEGLLPLLKYPNNGVYNDLCGLGCNTSLFGGYMQHPLGIHFGFCVVIHPYLEGICSCQDLPGQFVGVVIHPYLESIRSYIKQKPLIKILWKKHY